MARENENLVKMIMSDVVKLVEPTMAIMTDLTAQDSRKALLRKFKENYATLDLMTITRARSALGHKETEDKPCEVCRFIARKEISLQDEMNENGDLA